MTYHPGTRHNLPQLRVIQTATYISTIKIAHGQTIERLKYRYAMAQDATGDHFVYTGKQQPLNEGDVIDLAATIKRERNQWGYVRLQRIRIINMQPELGL